MSVFTLKNFFKCIEFGNDDFLSIFLIMELLVKYEVVKIQSSIDIERKMTLIFRGSRSVWRRSWCRGLRLRRLSSDPENHHRRRDHELSPDLGNEK